jgi:hypothetical protein
MKSLKLYLFLISLILLGCLPPKDESLIEFPQARISNEFIQAILYLPDSEFGFYRATRFDWSGIIASLEFNGHSYFGQWVSEHNPYVHESITGPVQEFTPLDFDNAQPGGHFLKIGVGVLKRPDDRAYRFATTYEVVNYGEWTYKIYNNRVEFEHVINEPKLGYSYIYQKIVRLSENKPELVLEHRLINNGSSPIQTSVYNHNFFVIDEEPTGPGIRTLFPYNITADGRGFGELIEVSGNELKYIRLLEGREQVYSAGVLGFEDTADDYDFRIENLRTGAGVRITGDRPLEKLVFWASATTSCPEPYIKLTAKPGREVRWQNVYEFYAKISDTN